MSDLKRVLCEEFRDEPYAHAYMHAQVLERLGAQLYLLRTARGMSQTDLASVSGVPQSKLSKLEAGDVSSFTLATLLKLAKAFDVAVDVSFEGFSKVAEKATSFTSASLAVASRTDDLRSLASVNRLIDTAKLSTRIESTSGVPTVTGVQASSRVPHTHGR